MIAGCAELILVLYSLVNCAVHDIRKVIAGRVVTVDKDMSRSNSNTGQGLLNGFSLLKLPNVMMLLL